MKYLIVCFILLASCASNHRGSSVQYGSGNNMVVHGNDTGNTENVQVGNGNNMVIDNR